MALKTPEPIAREHAELHHALRAAIRLPGKVGAAARNLAELLHAHFVKEEQYALPPLGLLGKVAARRPRRTAASRGEAEAMRLAARLRADLPQMLAEHRAIAAALRTLLKAARAAKRPDVVSFAQALMLHAQMEEAVTYPAAILLGRYLEQCRISPRARSSPRATIDRRRSGPGRR